MNSDKVYQIIGIYRKCDIYFGFEILLLRNGKEHVFPVNIKMVQKIKRGEFCEGDFVEITEEDSNGIVFELTSAKCKNSQKCCKEIKAKYERLEHLLNFERLLYLNDTLPNYDFNHDENESNDEHKIKTVEIEPVQKNGVFQGKIKILHATKNEELPVNQTDEIVATTNVSLNKPFIGKIHQKTRINNIPGKYNPFLFLIVTTNGRFVKLVCWKEHLAEYSQLNVGDIVYVQSFTQGYKRTDPNKLIYNTFTESMYFSCHEIKPNKLFKVENPQVFPVQRILRLFESVKGKVVYTSMIFRQKLNKSCLLFRYIKLLTEEDKTIHVVFYANSQKEFFNIENNTVVFQEMRKIYRGGVELYISTIYSQIEIAEDTSKKMFYNPLSNKVEEKESSVYYIHGGIGYLPDDFERLDDLQGSTETFKGKNKTVSFYFLPVFVEVEDLMQINTVEKQESKMFEIVANEARKYYVSATITSIEKDDLIFDYMEGGPDSKFKMCDQKVKKICINNDHYVLYVDNLFCDTSLMDKIKERVNKECLIFVDAMRIDAADVLLYITGILDVQT